MCFDLDSLPPVPVIAGAAVSHEDSCSRRPTATASPPSRRARGARARRRSSILPDVRGLYRFYEELALRFAERGLAAVAIDYFGRSAGVAKRDDDFPYMEHVAQTTPGGIQADVGAAVAACAAGARATSSRVGFCFGGRHSWLAAAGGHGLAGAVGFYGMPGERNGQPGPTERAAELAAPILALQAGADAQHHRRGQRRLRAALTAAGVEHEIVTYAGAPHSFFDRKHEEFAEASGDAWSACSPSSSATPPEPAGLRLENGFSTSAALPSWSCWSE